MATKRWWIGLLVACAGCAVSPDVAPCGTAEFGDSVQFIGADSVDMLFVIDDSVSMSGERDTHLVNEIPRLVRAFASGDRDADGVQDGTRPTSLHVGIVSTDLGGDAATIASCAAAGQDGILLTTPATTAGCGMERTSGIFDFRSDADDPDALAMDVGCVAVGTSTGCGVEQPLEAALRALSPATPTRWTRPGYAPPVFRDGTAGHGGDSGANAGFLRPDSHLAIFFVTNEDDCSVGSVEDELAGVDPSDQDPACRGASGLLPVQRFVDGLIGLRANPSLLTVAIIAGLPQLAIDGGLSYDGILAMPEMALTEDPASPGDLLPSCTSVLGLTATPPRRLVDTARQLDRLGARTGIVSICGASWITAIDRLIEATSPALIGRSSCLPRPLETDEDGIVTCEITAVLAPADSFWSVTHCSEIDGATRLDDEVVTRGDETITHEVCLLRALPRSEAGSSIGWYYDDGDPRLGAMSMLPEGCGQGVALSQIGFGGAELRMRCRDRFSDLPFCAEPP